MRAIRLFVGLLEGRLWHPGVEEGRQQLRPEDVTKTERTRLLRPDDADGDEPGEPIPRDPGIRRDLLRGEGPRRANILVGRGPRTPRCTQLVSTRKKRTQVEGHVLRLSVRHAKLRRDGYRRDLSG